MPSCRVAPLAAFLSLGSAPAPAGESIHLRASDVHDASYPTVRGLQAMSDRLDLASGGRIHLKIYPGAQLGDERDMLEMTIFGGIDISRTSIAPLNSIVPETGVFSLPFLFRSTDHMRRVLDSTIGDEILAGLEPHGLIGLAYYDAGGAQHVQPAAPGPFPRGHARHESPGNELDGFCGHDFDSRRQRHAHGIRPGV